MSYLDNLIKVIFYITMFCCILMGTGLILRMLIEVIVVAMHVFK